MPTPWCSPSKPQMLKQACAELLPHLHGELIVSIAARYP